MIARFWNALLCGLGLRERRDPHWPEVRRRHLLRNPCCAACGTKDYLEVHHIIPVHFPHGWLYELEFSNLITLCNGPTQKCHLWVGHCGDWKARNPAVVEDARLLLKRRLQREYPPAK